MQILLIYIIIYRIKLLYIFLSLYIAKSNYPVHTLCDTSKLPLLPVHVMISVQYINNDVISVIDIIIGINIIDL